MKRSPRKDISNPTIPPRRRRRKLLPNCNLNALHNSNLQRNSAIASQSMNGEEDHHSRLPRDANIVDQLRTNEISDERNAIPTITPVPSEHSGSNGHISDEDDRPDMQAAIEMHSEAMEMELEPALDLLDDLEENLHHESDTVLLPWTNLHSLLCVCGSVRLTAKQHTLLRRTLNWCSPYKLPSYRTVHRVLFPFLMKNCFPASKVHTFPIGECATMNEHTDEEEDHVTNVGARTEAKVRIVPPTEWAKLDVITLPLFQSMCGEGGNSLGICKQSWSVANCDIVRRKANLIRPTEQIFVDSERYTETAEKGDNIDAVVAELPTGVHHDFVSTNYTLQPLDRGEYKLQGVIAHVWCAQVTEDSNTRLLDDRQMLSDIHKEFVKETMDPNAGRHDKVTSINDTGVFPGDICALLGGCRGDESDWICVLVHRFYTAHRGSTSRSILWVCRERGLATRSWQVYPQVVREVKKRESGNPQSTMEGCLPPLTGTLLSGEKYFIYRILLYADDFETKSDYSATGSNGGCYMIPMNLPPSDRRSRSAVRTISVTPPGVSTNQIINFIIPDLVKGCVHGVEGVLPTGEKVRIFLDVLGFIGDYPASSHVIDGKTHAASAPCTLCNFKRFDGPHTRASKYGYTVSVNANNSSSLRVGGRHEALRARGIDNETERRLGMMDSALVNDTSCPLNALQRELNKHRGNEKRDSENRTIVTAEFDAYRSNFVAPDHLLTGLAKNVLGLLIELTPSSLRSLVDIRICDELRRNALIRQRTILKSNGKGLACMSLSAIFCTLTVAVPVFHVTFQLSQIVGSIQESAVALAQKLAFLIGSTYWAPQLHVDGRPAVARMEHNDGKTYLADLRRRALEYIQTSNHLCTQSAIAMKHLDKPNLHRLLELYTHTLPAFGHINHFMELVFETAHQPLKRCIVRGNHHNDHLSAVQHALGNDWQARLILLHREAQESDRITSKMALRGLRRLLVGENSIEVPEDQEVDIDDALQDVFVEPVLHQLRLQNAPINLRSRETGIWVGRGKSTRYKGELPLVHVDESIQSEVLHAIWSNYLWLNPFGPESANGLQLFTEMTRRMKREQGDLRVIGSCVNVLKIGDALQVLVTAESQHAPVITTSMSAEAVMATFCIVCLIDDGEYGIVAGVLRCETDGRILKVGRELGHGSIQLLRVNDQVRRIGLLHACHENSSIELGSCVTRRDERDVRHNRSLLKGGSYYYMTRGTGYPPRMA